MLAFILYRQHHQASVVAQHPGLANPEISKIIGEQWQNQSPEVKNKWKQLAEEEKIRHQQQYPSYRYQPKRNNRRNSLSQDSATSGEKVKCQKCGGRTTLAPSTPYSGGQSAGVSPASVPPTPRSGITPVSRTLPVLKELSLQSPAARRAGKFHPVSGMAAHYNGHVDDRDDVGPLSPDMKRRKYNNGHPEPAGRAMPPRYGAGPPGTQVGPGTPFPFAHSQMPPPPPPPPQYAFTDAVHDRRESLPGLRGVVNAPAPLGPPPPRPGMGYQQHRLSQGHFPHDRSLTLPPLQINTQPHPHTSPSTAGKTAEEQILALPFKYKIKVLCQVAPPASRRADLPRGPLIAVEGDSADTVKEMTEWLRETLSKDDLAVKTMEGPNVGASMGKVENMVRYHQLAAEWLGKSLQILQAITMKDGNKGSDALMVDAVNSAPPSAGKPTPPAGRVIDENYDSSDDGSSSKDDKNGADKAQEQNDIREEAAAPTDIQQRPSPSTSNSATESMDLDKTPTSASHPSHTITTPNNHTKVLLIPNYSLHTSNAFALRIPIGASDPYSPADHWQWTATQWRGIIGPDLTIYVRDIGVGGSESAAAGGSVDVGCVEGRADVGVICVGRKVSGEEKDGKGEIEPGVLRRLGFEVGEWVRGFFAAVGGRE